MNRRDYEARGCAFKRIHEAFDNEDQAALSDLLLSDTGHLAVSRIMTDAGHPMSEHSVRRHRRGDCTCRRN